MFASQFAFYSMFTSIWPNSLIEDWHDANPKYFLLQRLHSNLQSRREENQTEENATQTPFPFPSSIQCPIQLHSQTC
jgi:hypothetical protein